MAEHKDKLNKTFDLLAEAIKQENSEAIAEGVIGLVNVFLLSQVSIAESLERLSKPPVRAICATEITQRRQEIVEVLQGVIIMAARFVPGENLEERLGEYADKLMGVCNG